MAFGREMQVKLSHAFRSSAFSLEAGCGCLFDHRSGTAKSPIYSRHSLRRQAMEGNPERNRLVPMQIAAAGTRPLVPRAGINPVTTNALEPREDRAYTANGAGLSIDAFIPIIPGTDPENPGNTLTLVGEFHEGLRNQATLPEPELRAADPKPSATAVNYNSTDVDPGIVVFDQPVDAYGQPSGRASSPRSGAVVHRQPAVTLFPTPDCVSLSGIYSYLTSDKSTSSPSPSRSCQGRGARPS